MDSSWLKPIIAASPFRRVKSRSTGEKIRLSDRTRKLRIEPLEPRLVLASDFGDAPDLGATIGPSDYQTLLASNGPRHIIDSTQTTLFLGARVDSEANGAPNSTADGDDRFTALARDDEDGVVNPLDLVLTAGSQPTVTVRATNATGSSAFLVGWIDSNGDGVFDNSTERAVANVPAGTIGGLFTLTFPELPITAAGQTFARFRISSDVGSFNAVGEVLGGEVEDYAASFIQRQDGFVDSSRTIKLSSGLSGLPALANGDRWGTSVANLGDIDGDGVADLAVGAYRDDGGGGGDRGAVYVLLMNATRTVKSHVKIASNLNGGPLLENYDLFGSAVAALGDFDGDGISELAVGATSSGTTGAVYVLFLNSTGTVKQSVRLSFDPLAHSSAGTVRYLGSALANIGDLDGDGLPELAVGDVGATEYGFRLALCGFSF